MNQAVIVINGSARDENNTDRAIATLCPFDQFGQIDLRKLNIQNYNYVASQSDDFLKVVERLVDADVIVFATPVYWYAMSALMKTFFDRLTDLITTSKHLGRQLAGKEVYLIAQGSDRFFPEGFSIPFEKTAEYFGMKYKGGFYLSVKENDNDNQDPLLNGVTVALVPLRLEHLDGVCGALRSIPPETWNHLPSKLISYEEIKSWLLTHMEQKAKGQRLPFVVVSKKDERVLGSTSFLNWDRKNRSIEIGWTWLSKDIWGTGINTECKLLLLSHAFEHLGCERVQFKTDHSNKRSRGALEKIGATYEGTLRKHMIMSTGRYRDSAFYSITLDEWPKVKQRLEATAKL